MFACQRNSYLKELKSIVRSCKKVADKYHVLLDDTVLFPEGGGQPDDRGRIGDVQVERIFREGKEAVHVIAEEIKENESYHCTIDWERRFDHMQQHTGQHLLSAIMDQRYGFKTTSWDLGSKISNIELNTPKITQEQVALVEKECNEKIREHRDIVVHLMTKDEAMDVEEVKTRGLPDDIVDNIRVIEIKGIEKNMCCGTHLSNTSEIQVIKLLHTESMRGGTRLFFLAGGRVISKLAACVINEVNLTKLLTTGADEHVKSIEKIQKNSKVMQRSCKSYLKEIATLEALGMVDVAKANGFVCRHREDGDMDYINAFINQLKEKANDCLIMVCVGEVKNGGIFVIYGPESIAAKAGQKISEILDGKGGGKKNRYQGKASSFKNISEAESTLKTFLNQ